MMAFMLKLMIRMVPLHMGHINGSISYIFLRESRPVFTEGFIVSAVSIKDGMALSISFAFCCIRATLL
jgi:hypothetical protein